MPEIKFELPKDKTINDVIISIKMKDSDQTINPNKIYKTSAALRRAQKKYYQNNKEKFRERYRKNRNKPKPVKKDPEDDRDILEQLNNNPN